MSLDLQSLRYAWHHPPATDVFDHIPTREERFAEAEHLSVRNCIEAGGDPVTAGLGEHGALIGGAQKPCRIVISNRAFENRATPRLAPLSWFHYPQAMRPMSDQDPTHQYVREIMATYMAGYFFERPSEHEMSRMLLTPLKRDLYPLYEFFACLLPREMVILKRCEGLSLYQLIKAYTVAACRSPRVVDWANQFAVRPDDTQATTLGDNMDGDPRSAS